MLAESRFARHFDFKGDRQTHRGIFSSGESGLPFDESVSVRASSSCC
jgi:arsenite methyltransferase